MKTIPALLLSSALIGLAACATDQGYEDYLDNWLGQTESGLLTTWGEPNQTIDLDNGRRLLMYLKQKDIDDSDSNPNNPDFGQYNVYDPLNGLYQTSLQEKCTTFFTIQDELVVNFSWEGNACTH